MFIARYIKARSLGAALACHESLRHNRGMSKTAEEPLKNPSILRRGWTTGTCATAAARAAYEGLVTGITPAAVTIRLPGGQLPSFAIHEGKIINQDATASVIKDAGDDPDVTHGALVRAQLSLGSPNTGIIFRGGAGVGSVTRPGLPIPVGEPAINPGPRRMMVANLLDAADQFDGPRDLVVTIEIPNGQALAAKTMNGRLGIEGGLSILGTTGVVVPFSCAAWVHAIHSGIDVAVAMGLNHIGAATGSTSEEVLKTHYGLPEVALIDMGDFAGAVFKYLRRKPMARLTLAGGVGKLAKLAQGALDLHSGRSQLDFLHLSQFAKANGISAQGEAAIAQSRSAGEAMTHADAEQIPLASAIADAARKTALSILTDSSIAVDVVVIDRLGNIIGKSKS